MAVGLSDGTSYNDSADWFAASLDSRTDKQRSDQTEINTNSTAGDFQSRFYASDASTMPPGASTELAGALKQTGSTGTPTNRSVLEKLTGSDGGERYQTWPERLARSAFTLPGDVLSGKVEPGSIQEIERASDLAGLVVLGPAPVAAKLADGSLGSFAGVRSRTLPKDKLYEAQSMELDAMHPDDIWNKTGFFRGADQRWKYEIPDKDATLKMDAFDTVKDLSFLDGIEADGKGGWTRVGTSTPQGDKIVPKSEEAPKFRTAEELMDWFKKPMKPLILREVMDHPELFKAYPELGTMKVKPLPEYAKKAGNQGMVMGDTIYLNEGHPEYVRSVLLHEIQHGIQHHEGFAYGGNTEQFLPKELPQAEKEFASVKSEIEPQIKEALKVDDKGLASIKILVSSYKDGTLPLEAAQQVLRLKEEAPLQYKRLSNIVESERLIGQAKVEAYDKYTRLMGEVEARNVQARKNMSDFQRLRTSPRQQEDTPRNLQIE